MPVFRYSFPMVTAEDELRFRHLWASLTHDAAVLRADLLERAVNPFIQEVVVETYDGEEGLADRSLAGRLEVYRSEPLLRRRIQGFPAPVEQGLPEAASAQVTDTSWQDVVPSWVRPGDWVQAGDRRAMVLRIDVPAMVIVVRRENAEEPETIPLDALRFFGIPGGPVPPPPPPEPTIWSRLLTGPFDED